MAPESDGRKNCCRRRRCKVVHYSVKLPRTMSKALKATLKEYGRTIKREGWKAGESLIKDGVKKFGPKFKKWAYALGIMLRAIELLSNDKKKQKKGS